MSHHIDVPATRWFTAWREVGRLAACVSLQRGCAATIAENLISAAQACGTSAVRLFSPARVSSNQALLSGLAVWVLAGPAVRKLSGPALWAQAGPAVRQLSDPAVWAPTGPAVWAPTGLAVWGAAGGLDMVSATTFSLPGMCRMSLVYSTM
jgi:hypothetical protein